MGKVHILSYKFHIITFAISFLILTKFNIDPDLGWHLAYGERFLAAGEIIRADQFSWTMPGFEWGNSYFIYQILVAFLFEKLSLIPSGIIFGFIASLATLMLLPRKMNFQGTLLTFLAVGMAVSNLGIRPHVFDFLFFAILIKMLQGEFFKKAIFLPLWFALFAIWANFHPGFVVGLIALVAFIVIDFFGKFPNRQEVVVGATTIILATTGTLLTPFGPKLWYSIVFDAGGPPAWINIVEFLPAVLFFPLNLLYALSGLILIYIYFSKKSAKIEPAWLLLAAFFFMLPFLTVFLILFWSAFFIFLTTRQLDFKINLSGQFWNRLPIVLSSIVVFFALCLNFLVNILESYTLERRLAVDNYPTRAVKFLEEAGLTEGIFNDYGWGGYLDWRLPGVKVFIDGRMAGWRTKDASYILADYLAIGRGKCEIARKYAIKMVLVKKDAKVECFHDFALVYEDEVAKVLAIGYK